jgi:hypothetical protein
MVCFLKVMRKVIGGKPDPGAEVIFFRGLLK